MTKKAPKFVSGGKAAGVVPDAAVTPSDRLASRGIRSDEVGRAAALPGEAASPYAICSHCGAELPPKDSICPICGRRTNPRPSQVMETSLHWIVFLAMMTVIIAAGYILSP